MVMITAAVVSATAACASIRSSLGGGTDAPNACQVLTLDLVKPVIGDNAVQSISAQPNPRETHCQYKGSNGWIDAMVGEWSVIHLVSEPNEQPVAGIGDAAFTSFSGLKVRNGKHGDADQCRAHLRGLEHPRRQTTAGGERSGRQDASETLTPAWTFTGRIWPSRRKLA
ncbi:hypothetical protein [Mycobacterium sp. 852002-51163_SCH5372311]|uniref:hypothetical protein n=1 Tax=Mycobacterium sp. 852002-51163_SCH5372311 TaxID=1834097 RepID=UPI0012E932A4|nr:hypothetical protein [Mycobacterium sp. 852002-51163_SCH5372311]